MKRNNDALLEPRKKVKQENKGILNGYRDLITDQITFQEQRGIETLSNLELKEHASLEVGNINQVGTQLTDNHQEIKNQINIYHNLNYNNTRATYPITFFSPSHPTATALSQQNSAASINQSKDDLVKLILEYAEENRSLGISARKKIFVWLQEKNYQHHLSNDRIKGNDKNFAGLDGVSHDLSECLLNNCDFERAFFHYVNLKDADLTGANLKNANFTYATLTGVNLTDADLYMATLDYVVGLTVNQLEKIKSDISAIKITRSDEKNTEIREATEIVIKTKRYAEEIVIKYKREIEEIKRERDKLEKYSEDLETENSIIKQKNKELERNNESKEYEANINNRYSI